MSVMCRMWGHVFTGPFVARVDFLLTAVWPCKVCIKGVELVLPQYISYTDQCDFLAANPTPPNLVRREHASAPVWRPDTPLQEPGAEHERGGAVAACGNAVEIRASRTAHQLTVDTAQSLGHTYHLDPPTHTRRHK